MAKTTLKWILTSGILALVLSGCGRFEAQTLQREAVVLPVTNGARCLGTKSGQSCSLSSSDHFEDLNFSIFVGESRTGATTSSDIDVDLRLQGKRFGSDGSRSNVDLILSQSRFDDNGEDLLLEGDIWSFQIQSDFQNLIADIHCLEKFVCEQVVVNLVWQEEDHYFIKQFHIENKLHLEGDESKHITDGAIAGETFSEYRTDHPRDIDYTLSETSDGENTTEMMEVIINQEDSRTIPSRSGLIFPVDSAPSFDTMNFDFNSLYVDNTSSWVLDRQAVGHQRGGSLQRADRLLGPSSAFCVARPEKAFGTRNIINVLESVAYAMNDLVGDPMGIGNIAKEHGGKVADASVSHQNGLDVDMYFYQDNLEGSACQSPNALERPETFNPRKNYLMLKTLFQTAQGVSGNNRYSYVKNIYVHEHLRNKLCQAAIAEEGAQALRDETSDAYQTMIRVFPDTQYHHDHFHVRFSCHTTGCYDVGAALPPGPPCG